MTRALVLAATTFAAVPALGLTPRREIALAEIERRTARLEARLGELGRRITDGKGATFDPEDLEAITMQQRGACYRCE